MKNGNILEELREELRDWMRPVAHSVAIAKSFRNEGESADDQTQQQQKTDDAPDPFVGIDFDNLPDATKEALTKAKTEFANLQTKAKTSEAAAKAHEDTAKKFQSLADRRGAVLKSHNLDADSQQRQQQADPEQAEIESLAKEYAEKFKLDPAVARTYAEMNHIAYKRGKSDILKTVGEAVGPHLQQVGTMSVDRLLGNASQSQEYGDALANETVYTKTQEILAGIVSNGGPIDNATLDTSIKIAIGEALMTGKYQMNPQQTQQQQQQPRMTIRTNGGFNIPPMVRNDNRGGNGPQPANEDTAKAAARVAEHMRRGLPAKKN